MARLATIAVAALIGLLLAGCAGGGFAQTGASLPKGAGDGLQTVSDAADALDVHRTSASEKAKAAIGATDAAGSLVRDISRAERTLSEGGTIGGRPAVGPAQLWAARDKRIISASYMRLERTFGSVTDFCQSSAGFTSAGIPSLDVTFGWQSGAFSDGTRLSDGRGSATWYATATGDVVEGAIGALSIKRATGGSICPLSAPAFLLDGADAANAFSIPISIAFHRGRLSSLSVASGRFSNGESLDVTSSARRHGTIVSGVIRNGRTRLATFGANASGNGTLTITSSGAQYVIADWIVVST